MTQLRRTGLAAAVGLSLAHSPAAACSPPPAASSAVLSHSAASAGDGQDAALPDTVRVLLSGSPRAATVEQRLAGGDPSYLIRLPGQSATLLADPGSTSPDPFDAVLEGAYRLDVPASGRSVRITVEGRLDRIPLFVAAGEGRISVAREETGTVVVRVEATPELLADLDLAVSLPRFSRAGDGALIAELSSLPSFVRLARRDALSFLRILDVAVVILIVLGAVWAWRRGGPARAPEGDPG